MPAQNQSEIQRKAAAFDASMAAQNGDDRAARRTTALQAVARAGGREGAEAKRILAAEAAAGGRKAKVDALANLPQSLAEAGGDAHAYGRADMQRRVAAMTGEAVSSAGHCSLAKGRDLMRAELRRQGMEPAR